jgi:hypothetical protein
MTNDQDRPRKLAILIDADNASPRILKGLFEEVASIGEASVRRIYGDFSGARLKCWADVLSGYAIVPHQNFSNTTGKNASDIALVIDAMDLLHTGRIDGFCLVSSDSDFTRLASRIREQGIDVYGFGERKTPDSFRKACKRFIFTENLLPTAKPETSVSQPEPAVQVEAASLTQPAAAAISHIRAALSQLDDLNGWYSLGAVGHRLLALTPDFDPRTYGCPKLLALIERSEAFEIRRDNLVVYVREKKQGVAAAHEPVTT